MAVSALRGRSHYVQCYSLHQECLAIFIALHSQDDIIFQLRKYNLLSTSIFLIVYTVRKALLGIR